MYTYKYIILCILFFTAIPSKVIIAQQSSADSVGINELEDKYDSVITKAALSLTSAQYKEASDYYREASLLKPEETYPLKMIKYAEGIMAEAAEKQKLADELKRRIQIKDYLNKANNAILAAKWDSARILFSQILTLHPEKMDADYTKSKIEAIDLELKRIVLRTPPKPEPVVVAPPKNRSEARARRKLAERNATMASASAKAAPQTQTPAPVKNTVVAPAAKGIVQKPIVTPVQKPTVTPLPQKTAAINTPAKQAPAKSAESQLPIKNLAVAEPAAKEASQKPIQTASPTTNAATAAQPIKEAYQKPVQTTAPAQNVTVTGPAVKEVPKRPIESPLPATNPAVSAAADKEVPQKSTSTEATLPVTNMPAAAPAITKAAPRKTAETSLPSAKIPAAAPAIREVPQQPTEVSSSQKNGAAPLTKEIPTDVSLLKLSDSSDYIKLICKDISFIGTNAYVKVLVQNYSSTASFLTDTLQVSIKKNNGIVKKLDQRFISSFPVVTPLQETILVAFTDVSSGVEPDDVFILEMRNRKDKTTLALQIPWALYQQQKNL